MSNSFQCPNCGADVPAKARACPVCGSDEDTGWSEAATYVHLLPYDGNAEPQPLRAKPWFRLLTLGIAVVFSWLVLAGLGASLRRWRQPPDPAPTEFEV